MTMFEALVLGVVQGVTEFLPISSTAHLRIVPALAGWGDPGAALTAVLLLGTLVAVVGYFLPDLLRMLRAAVAWVRDRSRPPEPAARQLGYIVLGTVPVGIAGLTCKHASEGSLRSRGVMSGSFPGSRPTSSFTPGTRPSSARICSSGSCRTFKSETRT